MNRLVLIGNGFDLAHGFHTSYKDFICWYWKQWGYRLLHGPEKEESDGLCSFLINDGIDVFNWAAVYQGWHYKRDNPFIPELFDLNVTNAYSLIEWRSDKTTGEISPVSNCYPDFVLEYKEGKYKKIFSVECKWRDHIPKCITTPLISPEQIARYQEYSIEMNQDVFIVLGVGGEPSMPEDLYVIPIDVFAEVQAKPSLLRKYSRDKVDKWFAIEEFEHR